MITILNTLNENTINLGESLKVGGLGADNKERVNDESRLIEELMDMSKRFIDQSSALN